jgi:multiple sugar transport system substrate-binding protein
MRRTTALRPVAAAMALSLTMAACAPGNGSDDTGEATEPGTDAGGTDVETSELRVTVWTGNEAHLALFDEIADSFVADHPTVEEVNFEVLPFDNYIDALTVQLAGGNPPDLGWIFERNAPEFIDAGVLTDVSPTLRDNPDYAFEDLTDAATELWRDGDALYGYPFSTSPFSMFYNADMFAEAGLDTPDELYAAGSWTWDAARDAAAEIVAEDIAPHGFVVRDFEYTIWDNLATVWRGFGAQEWSDDGSQCGFAEPEMVEAMTFLHGAIFDDAAHPGPGQSADFFAGEAAMTVTQISRASLLEEDGFDWGVVPLPAGPAGDQQVIGQAGIAVFNASENQAAAADFLAHMTNEENSRKLAQFFPPPRASLLTADVLADTNPLLSEEQLDAVVVQGIANGTSIPTHVNFSQLQDAIRAELDSLWTADADVDAVMQQVCAVADPLL